MSRLAHTPIAYRHVVFPDALGGEGRAVDFSCVLADRSTVRPPADELALDDYKCVQWLFKEAGLDLATYRLETIKRRIPACTRALRVESARQVCAAVRCQPNLLSIAMSTLVIGVTSFFRDPAVFASLRETIMPELLTRSPAPRIWSVGCSDGAELYSMAILLAERGAFQRCSLLGTDCRRDAIARAREGSYTPEGLAGVSEELKSRYFAFDDSRWRVRPYMRAAVQWRQGNVLNTPEPGGWDLISCRNMAIYLQPTAAGQLWAQLENSLRPGGFLVLGKAERPYGATGLKTVAPCVYRRDWS
jgi:chemotaxis methyl-accepting protein methylase